MMVLQRYPNRLPTFLNVNNEALVKRYIPATSKPSFPAARVSPSPSPNPSSSLRPGLSGVSSPSGSSSRHGSKPSNTAPAAMRMASAPVSSRVHGGPSSLSPSMSSPIPSSFFGIAGLNPFYCEEYTRYFKQLDRKNNGRIDAAIIRTCFKCAQPAIPEKSLASIWNIANSSRTHGALLENDFYRALRLLALAQNGYPITLNAIGDARIRVPPPTFVNLDNHFPMEGVRRQSQTIIMPKASPAPKTVSAPVNTNSGATAPVDPFADLLGNSPMPPTNRGSFPDSVGSSKSSSHGQQRTTHTKSSTPVTSAPANLGNAATPVSSSSGRQNTNGRSKGRPSKYEREHYKKGEKVRYKKTGETVEIISPHFDDPDEMYYMIRRSDGSEKQTIHGYLEHL